MIQNRKQRSKIEIKTKTTVIKISLIKLSVSSIRDIAFYRCSEIIRARYFTIFTVYATGFG